MLFENDKIFSIFKKNNKLLHSDNFIGNLNEILKVNNFSLSDLDNVYFISGSGGWTGYRVSISFLTAMSILSKVKFFSIDSLSFQKGKIKNCLSVIKNNSRNYLLNHYENDVLIFTDNFLNLEQINAFNRKNLPIFVDLNNIDFVENFFFLKNKFNEFEI
ncbi:MAG TPA: hypothetical protein VN854_00820 [Mycoplasmatales bacterium]|jgi:tRNA A37 threonylcarbamoyladenosine modification protein TsaB|nr:hypothetical protein [Mycoplasmatales bacterium]